VAKKEKISEDVAVEQKPFINLMDIINKDKGSKDRESMSAFYHQSDKATEFLDTNVITLNLAISGRVRGGIPRGKVTMMSAPSQSGKSFVGMSIIKSAQKEGMSVVIVDTERSFSFKMAQGMGIDTDPKKLAVFQENGIEKIKSLILAIVDEVPKDQRDNILIVLDSWGTLVTSKSVADGLTGNDVMDMTEAKKKNNLANMLLNTGATIFVVNHVYDNVGQAFGDPLTIPGGRRLYFVSEAVVLGMSRAKEKNSDKAITGIIISAIAKKSRYSKEDAKFQFRIKRSGGLDMFYGLLDFAVEGGYVEKPKNSYYSRPHIADDVPTKDDKIYNIEFWKPIFKDTDFVSYLETKFQYSYDYDVMREGCSSEDLFN